ncbi:hypothetical protein MJN76_33040, partial [Salmonella enterica subsp. enterica serovar Anatum]|nr:hypothetical protein [Salmonella enterica subsp. enterica serovar Anatum]
TGLSLSGLMMQNELALHSKEALEQHFARVWEVMRSGIERGITAGHEWMTRGFDIYIPALFPHHTPFRYEQQEEAYRHFSANVGF